MKIIKLLLTFLDLASALFGLVEIVRHRGSPLLFHENLDSDATPNDSLGTYLQR